MTQILDLAQSLADRFYQEGIYHEEAGALDEALVAFRRAVKTDGGHTRARLALAYHCRRLNRLTEAIAHCRAALAASPSAEAYFSLGHMFIGDQRYSDALRALQRCLEMDPGFDQARYQIAFVYYLQGDYEVAITEFHRAAQRETDWETLFFLGECYRMTRRPVEAEHTFRRALALAINWGQVELTRGQLRACQRLAEFPTEQPLTVKDRAYCDCGVVYLGTSLDDGVRIPPYLFYHFTYPDLARTLRRFLALVEARGWRWEAVVPVDIVSLPLALALARHFGVGTEPVRDAQSLVVQALGETVEGLQDTADRLGGARTFCLLTCWPEEWHPDIVGLMTPLVGSLPWYRARALARLQEGGAAESGGFSEELWMDPRAPDAIATDILDALAALPDEPTLPEQVAYYQSHGQLRWT